MLLVCTNGVILSFLSLCSVLVYHGYTDANIGPWRMGARLKLILHQVSNKSFTFFPLWVARKKT